MNLSTFKARLAEPDTQVEVLAVDPVIYLIRVSTRENGTRREAILKNPKGTNWVFRSLAAVRSRLASWEITEATLVQQSPYGEMVGAPGNQQETEMRLPLRIGRPDD